MISEATLLKKLKDWDLLELSIREAKDRIEENTYRITACSSQTPSSGGSGNGKLENYCISLMKNKERLERLVKFRDSVILALYKADLNDVERKTIIYTSIRRSLLDVARKNDISQAGIYRVRDRAVKKMCDYINKTTN